MKDMSPTLRLYLAFTYIAEPIWRLVHKRRLKNGKELPSRLPEKYGVYTVARPPGEILWFHALSVGESFALLPLIERALADRPGSHAVLTTSTASSVEALAKAALPGRCIHVLLPIDTPKAVRAFLGYWSPSVAAFSELDFWPRLMVETHACQIPLILINSRMPDRNFASRKRLGGMMTDILGLFQKLLVQDKLSAERFAELGAPDEQIVIAGALKAAARPWPADDTTLLDLRLQIGNRPIWCAAATEKSEHEAILEAHAQVLERLPGALLIAAPRFKADGPGFEEMSEARFPAVGRRGKADDLTQETAVYIADTFGEMGLWYRLATVSFVGHSLIDGLEGKNPFEAAALGSAILTGPHMSYFSESYDALIKEGACRIVSSATDLADAVIALQNVSDRQTMTHAAKRVIEARSMVLTQTWAEIEALLPKPG